MNFSHKTEAENENIEAIWRNTFWVGCAVKYMKHITAMTELAEYDAKFVAT